LTVLLNQGSFNFAGSVVSLPYYSITGIAAGDFNFDNKMDIATTGFYLRTQVLFGNGDGTFHNSTVA
jgi:VCBS repeat protein